MASMTSGFTNCLAASLALALLLGCPNGHKDAVASLAPRVFEAQVGDVRLNSKLIEQGRTKTDTVSVEVPALIFPEPLDFPDVRQVKGTHRPEVAFVLDYRRANLEGTAEQLLAYWAPAEQSRVRALVDDEELFRKNRERLQKHPGVTLVGLVQIGETTVVLVRHSPLVVWGMSLRPIQGKWYLVNKPKDDLTLAIVEASFSREEVSPAPPEGAK